MVASLIPKKNCKSEASDSIHKWGFGWCSKMLRLYQDVRLHRFFLAVLVLCVWAHMCAWLYVGDIRGQPQTFFWYRLFFLKNFFWQRVSHWLGTSSSKLGYGWPRSLLSLPSWLLDYKCVCHHAWLFMWVLGNSNLPPHFTPKPSLQRCVLKFWHSGGCSSHFSLLLEKPRFRPEGLEGRAFYNKPSPVFLASSLWTYVAVP